MARLFWWLWVSGVEGVRVAEAIPGVEPKKIVTQKHGRACVLGDLLRRITVNMGQHQIWRVLWVCVSVVVFSKRNLKPFYVGMRVI